ncbi:MAG: hypothetical protein A2V93_03760 [Ignavibacteria bacterium RBG_16_34_14]|nr:MAG: hypothetical protein A2V93_03760 [Ignavibacteria bacterium RBG_16_34_14]
MPINIHVSEPQWFYEKMDSTNDGLMNAYTWRLDNQENILNLNEVLKTLENAVKRHPNTLFIACHLANQNTDLDKLGRLLDQYPNLYTDISARNDSFLLNIEDSTLSIGSYSWTIPFSLEVDSTYKIYIRSLENNQLYDLSDGQFSIIDSTTSISEETILTEYLLYQNYPNPFNPETTIKFALPFDCYVKLFIYDVLGNLISTLVEEEKQTGVHLIKFDASNLSSGIYFYKINAVSKDLSKPEFVDIKKFILLK